MLRGRGARPISLLRAPRVTPAPAALERCDMVNLMSVFIAGVDRALSGHRTEAMKPEAQVDWLQSQPRVAAVVEVAVAAALETKIEGGVPDAGVRDSAPEQSEELVDH